VQRLGSDPPGPYEATVGYSRVVRSGPHVWVAGCTSVDAHGVVHGDTPGEQMTLALQAVLTALQRVGATASDVVRTRMFTTDISRSDEIGRAHGAVFGDVRPVTAMYEVSGFIDPGMLVEVEADAYVEPGPER
jgi:enamine deaminase RidA (YjgF/YER057c/UK114 family)